MTITLGAHELFLFHHDLLFRHSRQIHVVDLLPGPLVEPYIWWVA